MIVVKQADAAELLEAFHDFCATVYFPAQGYTVIDVEGGKAVVGKNAATGQDNPNALTVRWDEIKTAPDGVSYFTSPANDARYVDWIQYMRDWGYEGQINEIVKDWQDIEEEVQDA